MTKVAHRRHQITSSINALLAITACWGVTLRVALLVCIPAAIVVLVALILGPTGLTVLAASAAGGSWLVRRRNRRRGR